MATAKELFEARHYSGTVAVLTEALDDDPECIPLLLLRARANIALRRDLDAQADLREVIRIDQCPAAYRLLGELAARSDEHESAAIFFREALRLDPDDEQASDWLLVIEPSARPAAVAIKLPAPVTAAGRFLPAPESPAPPRSRMASGSSPALAVGESPGLPGRAANPTASRSSIDKTLSGPQPLRRAHSPSRIPETPGFGDYLVENGILTRERLRAAQAYQRSMKVQLSTAIVTLGLATPQRIEWAAVAHQSQLARGS